MENEIREVVLNPAINLVLLLLLMLFNVLTFAFACWVYKRNEERNDNQDLFLKDLDKNSKL